MERRAELAEHCAWLSLSRLLLLALLLGMWVVWVMGK